MSPLGMLAVAAAAVSPAASPAASSSAVSPSPGASQTVSAALAKRVAAGNIGPGWVAFVFVVGIGLALFLLMRSMRHQVRKVTFVEEPIDGPRKPIWPERPALRAGTPADRTAVGSTTRNPPPPPRRGR